MRRSLMFGLMVIALGIGVTVYLGRREKQPALPGTSESGIVASDPARFGATGRPQLVEFFHHA